MATGYLYDQGWHDERARLAGIEALWDTGTQALLGTAAMPGARVNFAPSGVVNAPAEYHIHWS